ncbi:MAG: hypothetical protein ABH863_06295 [Candidatus Micrarchaeota archaeon]
MLLAALVLISSFILGLGVSRKFFQKDTFSAALLLGILGFTWMLFLLSMIIGFGEISILLTVVISGAVSFFILGKKPDGRKLVTSLFSPDSLAVFIIALLLVGYASLVAINFSEGMSVATQDFGLHLGIISTIANGNFPPVYPNFSSQPLTYYYFIHLFTASLVKGGLGHILAFQLILSLLVAAFASAFYVLARDILGSKAFAVAAILLMFIVSPCTGCQHAGAPWFSPFNPPDLAKMAVSGPKGFPYAPTLLSFPFSQFPLAIAYLFLAFILQAFVRKDSSKHALYLGLLIGLFPMFHAFFYLFLLGIYFLFLIIKREKSYLAGFALALGLGGLQFLTLLSDKAQTTIAGSFLRPELYAYSRSLTDLGLFWLLNLGGHLALAVVGLFFLSREKNKSYFIFLLGAAIIFLIGNFIILTPYIWDSNKLFLPFLMLVSILSAAGLAFLWRKNIFTKALFLLIFLLAVASSYYQFFIYFTPVFEQTPVKLSTPEIYSACEWISQNTPKTSVFLADDSLEGSSCIYAAGGRKALVSVPLWIRTHGFDDAAQAMLQTKILSGDLSLAGQHGVTHVFADSDLEKRISPELRGRLLALYSKDGVSIYSINYS